MSTSVTRLLRTLRRWCVRSREYIHDMLRSRITASRSARASRRGLFGIDEPLARPRRWWRLLLLQARRRGVGAPSRSHRSAASAAGHADGARPQARRCARTPFDLVPTSLRARFRETGVGGGDETFMSARLRLRSRRRDSSRELRGTGIGTTPRDPRPRRRPRRLRSRRSRIGDEGDPRAIVVGAVYTLEMIEVHEVKREFTNTLLTMTQEKNVRSRFSSFTSTRPSWPTGAEGT